MTSYLRTCWSDQKMSSFNVFQYKISNRMSYWRTFYDNFDNFQKLNFQCEVTIKSGQYLLLVAGFDPNKVDIRDQWWKLIEISWWPNFFWIITSPNYMTLSKTHRSPISRFITTVIPPLNQPGKGLQIL